MRTIGNKKIRVLLVDDSLAYRQLLRNELELDDEIEVVSHAVNGRLALPRIRTYQPDFVILDQEMPEMDGLETLRVIRDTWPAVGVIMFSSHTVEGARVTMQALEMGALDFVPKPVGVVDLRAYVRMNVTARIKQLARKQDARPNALKPVVRAASVPGGADVCAIGISTGGPVALREFLGFLPADFPVGILIVQHMPPLFTKLMADHLDAHCALDVREAVDGETVEAGLALVAPGGRHMRARRVGDRVRVVIDDAEAELNCRPSVNVLFRSVAEAYEARALALIMTGMGEDGYEGIRAIREKQGLVLAQSAESCLIYGMPARPTREGLIGGSYDIAGLARAAEERVRSVAGVSK